MTRERRVALIREIEAARNSRLICYITGDRENLSTRIAPDVTGVFFRHLELIGTHPLIDVLLYTRGGDVLTPWRLVHLIREYTDRLGVLVPFRAYSSGTLICLGADEVVMGKMGELGPIDPSVVNAFNPQDPTNPVARMPVNIEDVYSYLALACDKAGICTDEQLGKAFLLLGEHIHPLALGNVHRNYLLIRSLAKKLISLHQQPPDEASVASIVDSLTEKLYAHNHMIPRREAAAEIHLPVVYPSEQLEKLVWDLYLEYARELVLDEPFNPVELLHDSRCEFRVMSGVVESTLAQDAFVFEGVVERQDFPESGKINVNILKQGWRKVL